MGLECEPMCGQQPPQRMIMCVNPTSWCLELKKPVMYSPLTPLTSQDTSYISESSSSPLSGHKGKTLTVEHLSLYQGPGPLLNTLQQLLSPSWHPVEET